MDGFEEFGSVVSSSDARPIQKRTKLDLIVDVGQKGTNGSVLPQLYLFVVDRILLELECERFQLLDLTLSAIVPGFLEL